MQGARNEIFAMQPAPIQVSYMGFPGTTGASYIDYLVTDEVCMREISECYVDFSVSNPVRCFFVSSLCHLCVMHTFTQRSLCIFLTVTL